MDSHACFFLESTRRYLGHLHQRLFLSPLLSSFWRIYPLWFQVAAGICRAVLTESDGEKTSKDVSYFELDDQLLLSYWILSLKHRDYA